MKNNKIKNVIALYLVLSMALGIGACSSNTSETSETTSEPEIVISVEETTEETTVETTVEETVETTEETTEETSAYNEYSESVIMYGASSNYHYYDGTGLGSTMVGTIEVNYEYEVVGESNTSYYISIDGNVYRVAKVALSNEPVESEEEPEETDVTEPTENGENPNGNTTQPPFGVDPTPLDPNPGDSGTTSGYSAEPDFSVTCNGYTVSSYNAGQFGTVYGYYVSTDVCDSINSYRAERGLPQIPIVYSDDARYRALLAACASYNGMNMHVEIEPNPCIHTTGGFNQFVESDGHLAAFDGREETEYGIGCWSGMASAKFVICCWSGYGWVTGESATTVEFYW